MKKEVRASTFRRGREVAEDLSYGKSVAVIPVRERDIAVYNNHILSSRLIVLTVFCLHIFPVVWWD